MQHMFDEVSPIWRGVAAIEAVTKHAPGVEGILEVFQLLGNRLHFLGVHEGPLNFLFLQEVSPKARDVESPQEADGGRAEGKCGNLGSMANDPFGIEPPKLEEFLGVLFGLPVVFELWVVADATGSRAPNPFHWGGCLAILRDKFDCRRRGGGEGDELLRLSVHLRGGPLPSRNWSQVHGLRLKISYHSGSTAVGACQEVQLRGEIPGAVAVVVHEAVAVDNIVTLGVTVVVDRAILLVVVVVVPLVVVGVIHLAVVGVVPVVVDVGSSGIADLIGIVGGEDTISESFRVGLKGLRGHDAAR